jgi:hypothetical protein
LNGNPQPSLLIVVGINNKGNNFTKAHGKDWAAMISMIMSTIAGRPYAGRVTVVGGVDMELAWSSPDTVSAWAQGYGSNAYADFGDAPGCPTRCGSKKYPWSAQQVISLGGSTFIPEIYGDKGGAASAWAGLSKVNFQSTGHALNIRAPLSELTACLQREAQADNCVSGGRIDNTPTIAWIQMAGALAKQKIPGAGAILPTSNIEHRVP